jgi:8-oxo-dGTP pyrophosphatase MutT (NUDIX family)
MASGINERTGRRIQYAALPYRIRRDGTVEVRLITSRETRRWVIPKGWPMKGLTPAKAAARETYEEAGLLGTVSREPLGLYTYDKRLANRTVPCDVIVFPLKVKRRARNWPERSQRFGFWFPIESAAAAVQEEELKVLILAFGDLMAEAFAHKRGASGEADKQAPRERTEEPVPGVGEADPADRAARTLAKAASVVADAAAEKAKSIKEKSVRETSVTEKSAKQKGAKEKAAKQKPAREAALAPTADARAAAAGAKTSGAKGKKSAKVAASAGPAAEPAAPSKAAAAASARPAEALAKAQGRSAPHIGEQTRGQAAKGARATRGTEGLRVPSPGRAAASVFVPPDTAALQRGETRKAGTAGSKPAKLMAVKAKPAKVKAVKVKPTKVKPAKPAKPEKAATPAVPLGKVGSKAGGKSGAKAGPAGAKGGGDKAAAPARPASAKGRKKAPAGSDERAPGKSPHLLH